MKIRTTIRAGTEPTRPHGIGYINNHNESRRQVRGLKLRSGVRAGEGTQQTPERPTGGGGFINNHSETQVRTRGLKLRSGVRAGDGAQQPPELRDPSGGGFINNHSENLLRKRA